LKDDRNNVFSASNRDFSSTKVIQIFKTSASNPSSQIWLSPGISTSLFSLSRYHQPVAFLMEPNKLLNRQATMHALQMPALTDSNKFDSRVLISSLLPSHRHSVHRSTSMKLALLLSYNVFTARTPIINSTGNENNEVRIPTAKVIERTLQDHTTTYPKFNFGPLKISHFDDRHFYHSFNRFLLKTSHLVAMLLSKNVLHRGIYGIWIVVILMAMMP